MQPPSGRQYEIRFGQQRAVIVEVGGGLREYTLAGRHLVDGYGVDEMASGGRGQVLMPWPNRIEDGRYEFDGRTHQLALTEPARHNASHGLVRWANWTSAEHEENRVLMQHALHPQPGYPFSLDLEIEYSLSADGLSVSVSATNVGGEACPLGAGAHPYLTLGTSVDGLLLEVPARTVLLSNERGIPSDSLAVKGTFWDFQGFGMIGDRKLDHAFTDLQRRDDGRSEVRLHDIPSGRQLTLWVDAAYTYLMVFTGDTLATGARQALAVEPMTCPPNAFRSGVGVIRLEPGQTTTSRWGISPGAGWS